jgi:hypothetical protein
MPQGTLLPRADPLKIDSAEFFWIENIGTKPLRYQWAKVVYGIAPSEKKYLPFPIVALYYGDPRSRIGMVQNFQDSTGEGQVPERNSELMRLCVRYGVYEQGMEAIHETMQTNIVNGDHSPLDDRNFYVTITNAEGQEIFPPLFDPKGEFVYGFTKDMQKSGDVATIIDNLQAQIDELRRDKEAMDVRGYDNNEDIGVDEPIP